MEGKRKTSKQKRQAEEQNKREIIGICLIALGLFLGASMYSDAVGLAGKAISAFFFGVFGLGGYAVPAVVVLFGVLVYELVGPTLTKRSLLAVGDIKPEGRTSARKENQPRT